MTLVRNKQFIFLQYLSLQNEIFPPVADRGGGQGVMPSPLGL